MFENLVFEGPYSNKDFFNFIKTSQEARHRWYYFKEGFSSNVVKEAISAKSSRNKSLNVLDFFNGCGTTALTAALLGHRATGIEVNPFLAFTTKVKTDAYDLKKDTVVDCLDKVVTGSRWGIYSNLEGFSTFTNHSGNEKWLFNTSVIRRYAAMQQTIEEFPRKMQQIFRFLLLSAVMECCNARKDGKSLRYKRNWSDLKYSASDLVIALTKKVNIFLADIESAKISRIYKPNILLGDSRKLITNDMFDKDSYDLIVTSPPYLNSFDYSDIYRAELFMGGFVNDNNELRNIRLSTLRSHVQVDWKKDLSFESRMLKPYIDQIEANGKFWNARIPLMIKAYFDDLNTVLEGSRKLLKRGAEVWIVVSTSAYAGVHIPVDLLIADLACTSGYTLKGIHCLRYLRTSSQQYKELNATTTPLRESLIILKK